MRIASIGLIAIIFCAVFTLGFLSPASAFEAIEYQFSEPVLECPIFFKLMDTSSGKAIHEQHLSIDSSGMYAQPIHVTIPSGSTGPFMAELFLDSGTGMPRVHSYDIPEGSEGTVKIFVDVNPDLWNCNGEPPPPEPQFGNLMVCVEMPEGVGVTVKIFSEQPNQLIVEDSFPMTDCRLYEQLPEGVCTVVASAPGYNDKQMRIHVSPEYDNTAQFKFRLPPDPIMTLSTKDEKDVQMINVNVGDRVLLKVKDQNNPDLWPNFARIYVDGLDNRLFTVALQWFDYSVGWGSNAVMFVPEHSDAGKTLEITADMFVHMDDPTGEDPTGGQPTIVPVPPVYINVAAIGGGGNVDELRAEIMQILNEIQQEFTTNIQNIRIEFSDGLETIGNIPVREGNQTTTLQDMLINGGTYLRGHFPQKGK